MYDVYLTALKRDSPERSGLVEESIILIKASDTNSEAVSCGGDTGETHTAAPAPHRNERGLTGCKNKTYSSGYSHVVTHRSTNPPIRSLSMPERTGWPVLYDLWPYVLIMACSIAYVPKLCQPE